jgi:hypothetical protein
MDKLLYNIGDITDLGYCLMKLAKFLYLVI